MYQINFKTPVIGSRSHEGNSISQSCSSPSSQNQFWTSTPDSSVPKLQVYLAIMVNIANFPSTSISRLKFSLTPFHCMNQEEHTYQAHWPTLSLGSRDLSSCCLYQPHLIFSVKPPTRNLISSLAWYLFLPFESVVRGKHCIFEYNVNFIISDMW